MARCAGAWLSAGSCRASGSGMPSPSGRDRAASPALCGTWRAVRWRRRSRARRRPSSAGRVLPARPARRGGDGRRGRGPAADRPGWASRCAEARAGAPPSGARPSRSSSSATRPSAASSFARQSACSASPRSHSVIASSSDVRPSSSLRTISSSSSRASSKVGSARRHSAVSSTRATRRPRARRTPHPVGDGNRRRVADDRARLVLHDRVAALERRRRAEHAQAAVAASTRADSRSSRSAGRRARRSPLAASAARRTSIQACGRAKAGRDTSSSSVRRACAAPPSSARAPRARRASSDASECGVVGHHHSGRQAGRPGAGVGDQVDERVVLLVADRRDHRRRALGDRPADDLVGERQQVLGAAAAAGQHDDIDVQCRRRASSAPRRSTRARPAPAPSPRRSGTEPAGSAARRSRSRLAWPRRRSRTRGPTTRGRSGSGCLRSSAKSPSAAELRPELLDPLQELAEAELLEGERPEPELAALAPELAAAVRVQPVAGGRRGLDAARTGRGPSSPGAPIRRARPSGRRRPSAPAGSAPRARPRPRRCRGGPASRPRPG